jgi:TonB family protein
MTTLTEKLLHVFQWPVAHPIRLLLPGMIAVSLLVHALAAYLVRSGGAPRPSLAPWPAKIAVIPASDSPQLLLLAARDPSWLDPGRYRASLLPPPRHERAALALDPALPPLLEAPRSDAGTLWVPALPPLAVKPWFEETLRNTAAPSFVAVGARFESGQAGVTEDVVERLRSVAPDRPPGRATELLLVLSPAGDVRHAWVLRGSGDAALDLSAQRAVQRARFAPSEGGRRDVLRIFWGPRGPQS